MAAGDYFYERTRGEFLLDLAAWQATFSVPLGYVAHALGLTEATPAEPAPSPGPPPGAGSPPPPPRPRVRNASPRPASAPRWYRQVAGRTYHTHDLNARDPERFAGTATALRGKFAAMGRWLRNRWGTGEMTGVVSEPVALEQLREVAKRVTPPR